jgi:hypothetical protein
MSRSRLLLALLALTALTATAPADAAKPRAKKKPADQILVTAQVVVTSKITTRCKIISSNDAWSIETATTTYKYGFDGASPVGRKDLGRMKRTGEHTYLLERQVEGESEYVKPMTLGPTVRPLGEQNGHWGPTAKRVRKGKGKKATDELRLDFESLGLPRSTIIAVPKRGGSETYALAVPTKRKPVTGQGGECTASDETAITGTVTIRRT